MKRAARVLALIGWLLVGTQAIAQVRSVINFNGNWQFTKGKYGPTKPNAAKLTWQNITLPHTWNATDVMDDQPGYYRAACWYLKSFTPAAANRNKKLYLYFNGANQQTEVYVNGQMAGSHTGGYTGFTVELSKYLKYGQANHIAVKVDNSYNEDIAPLTADFTFFGGIYRNVSLLALNNVHFSLDHGANGVFISTPQVSAQSASVNIRGKFVNAGRGRVNVKIQSIIYDKAGKAVSAAITNLQAESDTIAFEHAPPNIANPHLWAPEDPYLYKITTRLISSATGKVLDEVSNPLGFRWFKFNGEKGLFLNGKPYKLIGASRHQDFMGMGNALPDSYHVCDVKLLKQMGGNFLRVAHYPQDPAILAACDSLGLLASVEIPVVNAIAETPAFAQNSKNMLVEMVRQNYNHPSIVIWAYMNEVLLKPRFNDDKPRQQIYFKHVKELAAQLDSLTRREDPARYTMIACHGDYNRYKQVGIVDIPMLIGWNLYQGWYGGKTEDFAKFLDKFHADYPALPMLITEYGADADSRIRSLQPERFDKSMDYAVDFHNVYLKAMQARPFVAAAIVWNLADFSSEERGETTPHINAKGLLTQDRKAKDVYRFYQANLLQKPFLKISNWVVRTGIADSANQNISTQPLSVFTNAKQVKLKVNGADMGSKATEDGMATWNVTFKKGDNIIEASAGTLKETTRVKFDLVLYKLKSARASCININALLGAKRFYLDKNTTSWLPAARYKTGSFGYTGGQAYKMAGNSRQSYGSDRDILTTTDDPIYQTQQVGIQSFTFDVPDGKYQITLHFAELTTDKANTPLAYNLDNAVRKETLQERVFNISVNNQTVLKDFDAGKKYGPLTAGLERFTVTATGNKGIVIKFTAAKGEAVLNAIQLKGL